MADNNYCETTCMAGNNYCEAHAWLTTAIYEITCEATCMADNYYCEATCKADGNAFKH